MKIEDSRDFGTRECPSCACEIPENSNTCPICGYHFPVASPRQNAMRYGGALLMLGLILFLYLLRFLV